MGIAEQHAVTMAAGMAMGGLRPVVAVYSTFFARAFDQANLDVGLHGLPVVFALDRAGITGDDGPSHHGVLDMALCLRIPGMTVMAPSSVQEVREMLRTALTLEGPAVHPLAQGRRPLGPRRPGGPRAWPAAGSAAVDGSPADVCILAVGKLVEAAERGRPTSSRPRGSRATVWDVRVVKPLDPEMLADAARHPLVVTAEDGVPGRRGRLRHRRRPRRPASHRRDRCVQLGDARRLHPQGKPDGILADLGLDAAGIAATVRAAIAHRPPPPDAAARRRRPALRRGLGPDDADEAHALTGRPAQVVGQAQLAAGLRHAGDLPLGRRLASAAAASTRTASAAPMRRSDGRSS